MTSFGWFKHKQKSLEFAQQHLELKIHFESKLILIQCLDEEDWIKSMYTQYITNIFSMATRSHVCDLWNITKQKEIGKIMQCPSIKSPSLWYGSGFFLKNDIIMHSLLKKGKRTHFKNGISSRSYIYIYIYI
jgi:hypothetical protein